MKTLPESPYTLYGQKIPANKAQRNSSPVYKATPLINNNSYKNNVNGYNNGRYADSFETEQRRQERRINRERRKQRAEAKKKAQRRILAGAAIVSGFSAAILNLFGGCQAKPLTPTTDTEAYTSAYIDQYEGSTYEDALNDLNIEETQEATNKTVVEEILNNNPDVKYAYDNLSESVNRFSDELGEDAIPLIKDRIEQLGNGKVEILDVLKVLHIESRGRIYDPENPNEILKSSQSSATGAFQLKPDTVDYINYYFNLTGTPDELDVLDPYDNLDACILYLRIVNSMRQDDIDNGIQLPTGNNIKHAMVWGYHDGPWSQTISYYAQQYIEDFDKLSAIENYPEVVDYLLNE